MKMLTLITTFFCSLNILAASYDNETLEITQRLTDAREIRFNYCISGTLTCRTLVLLKNKQTNETLNLFYNNFFSSERAVALTGYFLRNESGTYRAYSDGIFDGKIKVDTVNDWDKNINITFDDKGFPTAHGLNLKTLGTSKYAIADLTFNETECTLKGIRYDYDDPNFSAPIEIIYKIVK